jgi:hypothetical protein
MPGLTVQEVNRLVSEHGGPALIVDGEPRYHVDGCALLPARGVEEADVRELREEGFTACRSCRPNRALAERAKAEQAEAERWDEQAVVPRPAAIPSVPPPPAAVPTAAPPAYAQPAPLQEQYAPVSRQFVFDGGAATYVGTAVLAFVITLFTIGIAYPFALVLRERWRAKHSLINGQRLTFNGTGTGLFGLWIKWILLSIVTVGIYLFWVGPRIARWKWQHTGFVNQVVVRPVQ